jgi:pilus assembly protein CpaE
MDKIRILLLVIFPRVEQRIKTLLNSIAGVEIIDEDVNDAEAAIDVIFREKPDVVLLENDFPGQDGFYLTELIRKEVPLTQIVILSEISSAEAVRQAMRAGACDYLSYKTVTLEELTAALEHAHSLSREEKSKRRFTSEESRLAAKKQEKKQRARIITFYSPKGGTGVSTIIANLAYALQKGGRKILIVDGDLQYGDIAVLYNQFTNRTLADIADKVDSIDADMINSVLVKTSVDILPAPNEPEQAVQITGQGFTKLLKFVSLLDYDIVLVNTSSYITDPCFSALETADIIVLVTVQEIAAVRATRSFITLVEHIDIGKNKLDLVLNRFDPDSSLTPQSISKSLNHNIALTLPADATTATNAANLGKPFVAESPSASISKGINALADHLKNLLSKLEPVANEETKETSA